MAALRAEPPDSSVPDHGGGTETSPAGSFQLRTHARGDRPWDEAERVMSRQRERDAAEEIESHIEERIAELEEAGIPREQAAHEARREFGNATIITEDSRAI